MPEPNGTTSQPTKKSYHTTTSGLALRTAQSHSAPSSLTLYGSCFCPFVQRVWIALELNGLSYRYLEIDPYSKPAELLEINPRGLVPALRHGDWGCYESTVLMEFLEDLQQQEGEGNGVKLLPSSAREKAYSRLWTDHVNRHIVPGFYRVLQAQEVEKQADEAGKLKEQIAKLVDAADKTGPFFLGSRITFVDVQIAPWVLRLKRVLKPYRGWPDPEAGSRWERWVDAIEGDEAVKRTTSEDVLYLESYERYAENRPGTSQVARAVNEGRGLP